jgi:DNA polymerase-3 subunit chi
MGPGLGEVWFYHLERASLEDVLPDLLEKTLARGWRALVWSRDLERLNRLDERLWTWRDDSFLPHGMAHEALAERQPILLSTTIEPLNGAAALFVLDGDPGELRDFARTVIIFEGQADAELDQARDLWARYRKQGLETVYWRQNEARGWTRQT